MADEQSFDTGDRVKIKEEEKQYGGLFGQILTLTQAESLGLKVSDKHQREAVKQPLAKRTWFCVLVNPALGEFVTAILPRQSLELAPLQQESRNAALELSAADESRAQSHCQALRNRVSSLNLPLAVEITDECQESPGFPPDGAIVADNGDDTYEVDFGTFAGGKKRDIKTVHCTCIKLP